MIRKRVGVILLFIVALGGACGKKAASNGATTMGSSAVSAFASSSALVAEAGAPVDLLYTVPSLVAVSSRVDNPKDLPDFIVDRKPETAWNGRTGDLVGGYVAFRVPKDAEVKRISLQVGYDKKKGDEDLFTANVRIRSVKVFHDRKLLKTATFDTDVRGPQHIDIDTKGGDFILEVTEVTPGTKKTWRELVVSELWVWGKPGAKVHKKPTAPFVRVGGLNEKTPTIEHPKKLPTIDAACRAFITDSKVTFDEQRTGFGLANLEGEQAPTFTCALAEQQTLDAGTSAKTAFMTPVTLDNATAYPGMYDIRFTGQVLGIRTSTGAFVTNVRLAGRETAWYWTSDFELLSIATDVSAGRDVLVIQALERRVTDGDGYGTPEQLHGETVSHLGTLCDLDAQGQLTCKTASTDLTVKLKEPVKPSPTRRTPAGEIVFDVLHRRDR